MTDRKTDSAGRMWSIIFLLSTVALVVGCAGSRRPTTEPSLPGPSEIRELAVRAEAEPTNRSLHYSLLRAYLSADSLSAALRVADRLDLMGNLPGDAAVWIAVARFESGVEGSLELLLELLASPHTADSTVQAVARELGCPYTIQKIASLAGDAAFPFPSPDGKKVAFQWNREAEWDIYVLNLVDSSTIAVVQSPARDESPCFSPDGRTIAFTSTRNDTDASRPPEERQRDIFVIGVDGSSPVCVVEHPADDWYPRFAHDGKSLFFVSERGDVRAVEPMQKQSDLYRLWLSTGQVQRLTDNDVDDTSPWPALKSRLLFFARNEGGTFTLYTMDLPTFRQSPVHMAAGVDFDEAGAPCFSDARTQLVFVGRKDRNYDIWLYDLTSKRASRLTRHPALDQAPVFGPEGRYVYFHSNRDGRFQLYRVDLARPCSRSQLVRILTEERKSTTGKPLPGSDNLEERGRFYGGD